MKKADSSLKAIFFDLDGCIYHGKVLNQGAKELLNHLRHDGLKVGFMTNNSTDEGNEIVNRLVRMGLDVDESEVFTATDYTGIYLKRHVGTIKVKVSGSESLKRSLACSGHTVLPLDDPTNADVVVVGRDVEFTYNKLQQIERESARGAKVISVNPDRCHPGSSGERVPETGALVAAIEAVIGQKVDYIGKPAAHFFKHGMDKYGLQPDECVMVGDNVHTDITGGISAGMHTIWLTEDNHMHDAVNEDTELRPSLRVKNMLELYELYQEGTFYQKLFPRK